MSPEAQAILAAILPCLGTLAVFVWRAASTTTEHRLRIESLERADGALVDAVKKLTASVNRLDKKLAVSNARASQGQFGDSDTDPPGAD